MVLLSLPSLASAAAWHLPSFGRAAIILLFGVVLVPIEKTSAQRAQGKSTTTQRRGREAAPPLKENEKNKDFLAKKSHCVHSI